jgi:hypothetical protein
MKYIAYTVITIVAIIGVVGGGKMWLEYTWKSRVENDAIWISRYLNDGTKKIDEVINEIIRDQKYSFNHKDWILNKDGPYWVTGPTNYGRTLYIKWDKMIMWDG